MISSLWIFDRIKRFFLKWLMWKKTSTTTTTWTFMIKFIYWIFVFKNIIFNDEQNNMHLFLLICSSIQNYVFLYFWFLTKTFSMTTTTKKICENKCIIKIYMIEFIYISLRQFTVFYLMRCAKWKNFCKSKFHVVWI